MKHAPAFLTLLTISVGVFRIVAQTPSPMDLNRLGKWDEAVVAARRLLVPAAEASAMAQRCETRAQLIYALGRLRHGGEARDEAATFKKKCTALPADHWARKEIASILKELESAPAGAQPAAASNPIRRPAVPARDEDWTIGAPETVGLDPRIIADHRDLCRRSAADACVVVRNGRLADEWYGPNYAEPIMVMSSTKSITSLLVGLLIEDKKLSIDDPVSKFIPEWKAGASGQVTIRHLLTMTSGLPDDRSAGDDVGSVTDKEAFAFARPLTAKPGTSWAYTNNGVFLLSPIIKRAAGEPVADYARRRLFLPLGMRHTRMHVYPEGQAWTHADMETTPRDFARIGQMMLDGGRWQGKPVVSEAWIRASTERSQPFAEYGLLWWLNVRGGFAARGYLDTNLYVFPSRHLVVVRMQAKPAPGAPAYEREAMALIERMTKAGSR